jgi:short-subunit dehydrogenase
MSLPEPRPDAGILVTGASSGIGEEIARQLAAKGHHLILVARRVERLETLADELGRLHGIRADVLPADLGDPAARDRLVTEAEALGVALSGLVNNAGLGGSGFFAKSDQEHEREMVRVNVDALHHLTGAFLPGMVGRGEGAVLNVASLAANQPLPLFATYAATKAFVLSFSEALHGELSGTGVSVTALCPGPVPTEFGDIAGMGNVEETLPGIVTLPTEQVAREAIDGMERGRRTVTPGLVMKGAALAGRFTPRALLLPIARTGMRQL